MYHRTVTNIDRTATPSFRPPPASWRNYVALAAEAAVPFRKKNRMAEAELSRHQTELQGPRGRTFAPSVCLCPPCRESVA